jgi:hypothetical protein
MWEYILQSASVEGLTASQQITCLIVGSQICVRSGLHRKAGLLTYMAGLVAADREDSHLAHSLLDSACRQYSVLNAHEKQKGSQAWIGMRRSLLAYSAYTARQSGDIVAAAR